MADVGELGPLARQDVRARAMQALRRAARREGKAEVDHLSMMTGSVKSVVDSRTHDN